MQVVELLRFAATRPDLDFFVSPIGCKNAGFGTHEIARLFLGHMIPQNIVLNTEFARILSEADRKLNFVDVRSGIPIEG